MADTRQVVFWSLEQKCPFRRGDGWEKPSSTGNAVQPLQLYSTRPSSAICGDICLTGWSYFKDETTPIGFRISHVFEKYGGLANAQRTCGNCPANVWSDGMEKMGGCWGVIGIDPDEPALQEAVAHSIASQSLQAAVASAFLPTDPLWYGFWINSPLSVEQCDLLTTILSGVALLGADDRRILLALEASLIHHLPLHVNLTPLGHTDLGIYTVFPHCPRCKAFAGFRWRSVVSLTSQTCKVCGNSFRPGNTGSSESMDHDDEFWRAKLTPEEIADILKTNTPPLHPLEQVKEELRKINEQKKLERKGLMNRLRSLFGGSK
jgi:hypothetical protein